MSEKSLRNKLETWDNDSDPDSMDVNAKAMVFQTIPRVIPLVIKLGFVYLGFKRKAKKAGKVFEKELLANGIDKDTARALTDEYLKTSHFLKQFDFSGMVKNKAMDPTAFQF